MIDLFGGVINGAKEKMELVAPPLYLKKQECIVYLVLMRKQKKIKIVLQK